MRDFAQVQSVIVDLDTRRIFPGDTFGISYREFDVDGHEFVMPTTTPVHFDPEALKASVDRLLTYAPRAMYLTHYSEVRDVQRLAGDLKRGVNAFVALGRELAAVPQRAARMREAMFAQLSAWLDEHGYAGDTDERHRLLDDDIDLNVQGIDVWLDRL